MDPTDVAHVEMTQVRARIAELEHGWEAATVALSAAASATKAALAAMEAVDRAATERYNTLRDAPTRHLAEIHLQHEKLHTARQQAESAVAQLEASMAATLSAELLRPGTSTAFAMLGATNTAAWNAARHVPITEAEPGGLPLISRALQ